MSLLDYSNLHNSSRILPGEFRVVLESQELRDAWDRDMVYTDMIYEEAVLFFLPHVLSLELESMRKSFDFTF